jgi:hypothetical protein
MGLDIDEAAVSGSDVHVSSDPFAVTLGNDAEALVRVSCESIQRFLSTLDLGGLRDIAVSTQNGLLQVSGTAVVLVPIRATALCALEVEDGARVNVVLKSAEPGAAFGIIHRQLAGINPILDLASLPFNLVIQGIEVADGWVEVRGGPG